MYNRGPNDAQYLKEQLDVRTFLSRRYDMVFDRSGRARCPMSEHHKNGDANPSFWVKDGHCKCALGHFGEKGTDVYGVIQKMEGIGFSDARKIVAEAVGVSGKTPTPRSALPDMSRETTATSEYVYTDPAGDTVRMARRTDYSDGSKKISLFSPDGNGGWSSGGGKGQATPLYRIPEVRDGDDPVVIVEGEKVVEALCEQGVNATTCIGGAGKFTEDHAQSLKNRDVVVWPDKDEPGRKHAEDVCNKLTGHAKTIRQVEPPTDLKDKGDAADLVENGRIEEVHRLIADAPTWSPPVSGRQVICLADVVAETPKWLWYPRIPAGYLTLLFGDGGVGKTHVCLALTAALSKGSSLPGGEGSGVPSNCVYFTGEDQLPELKRRLDEMDADPTHLFACAEAFSLGGDGMEFIEQTIAKHDAELAIIDPVVAFLGGDVDFYRANETRALLAPLSDVAERTGAAIVLSTHVTKGQTARAAHRAIGSGDFVNAARSALLAGSDPDDPSRCGLFHEKANLGPKAPPLGYTIKDGRFGWTGETNLTSAQVLGGETVDAGSRTEAEGFLAEILATGGMPAKDVLREAEAAGIADRTLRRAKEQLCHIRKAGFDGGWIWELKA